MVHLWGLPCKVGEIRRLADAHGLKIIEDASHAHGASVDGVPCGRFGDVSVFSLQGDKLVPAGEGGVFLTDDEALYKRALCLGDITRIIRMPLPEMRFAATSFGIKTRIAPMSAALGRAMLARLPETNAIRNRNHQLLSEALEPLGFDCFMAPAGTERVYFEFIIRPRDPGRGSPAPGRNPATIGLPGRPAALSAAAPTTVFHRRPLANHRALSRGNSRSRPRRSVIAPHRTNQWHPHAPAQLLPPRLRAIDTAIHCGVSSRHRPPFPMKIARRRSPFWESVSPDIHPLRLSSP